MSRVDWVVVFGERSNYTAVRCESRLVDAKRVVHSVRARAGGGTSQRESSSTSPASPAGPASSNKPNKLSKPTMSLDAFSDGSDEFQAGGSDFDFDTFSQDGDVFDDVFDEDDLDDLEAGSSDDHIPIGHIGSSTDIRMISDDGGSWGKRISSSPSSMASHYISRHAPNISSKTSSQFAFSHPPTKVGNGPQFQVHEDQEVRNMCNEALNSVIEFYPVSRIAALQLLKKNKWDSEKVINFLVDSASATLAPGATADSNVIAAQSKMKKQKVNHHGKRKNGPSDIVDSRFYCLICFESVDTQSGWSPPCGHLYCRKCWSDYFNVSIRDGEMFIECIDPACHDLINGKDIEKFVTPKTFSLYQKIFYRQYVNDHPWMRPCPAPGCERVIRLVSPIFIPSIHTPQPHHAVEPSSSSSSSSSSSGVAFSATITSAPPEDHSVPVRCCCGGLFCFLCRDNDIGNHTPATCQQVQRWMEKVSSEAENVNWIIANTKKCPKCRAPIEKNGGCMHMTCSPSHGGCGHQWCWLCWGPWSEHGTSTGGFYHCNKYDSSAAKAHDLRTSDVRTDLETYMFYFHRYDSHRNAGKVASNQLGSAEKTGFHFQEKFNVRAADTKFLQEATQQLLENRRALQWSYVYGYYLRLNSTHGSAERNFF